MDGPGDWEDRCDFLFQVRLRSGATVCTKKATSGVAGEREEKEKKRKKRKKEFVLRVTLHESGITTLFKSNWPVLRCFWRGDRWDT